MRRLLFLLTLALYGSSAMELHEWARVPQVVLHLLEHHSDLGHHHDDPAEHGHGDDEDGHNPFGHDQHEACGAGMVSIVPEANGHQWMIPATARKLVAMESASALSAYSGSKWNPPKQA